MHVMPNQTHKNRVAAVKALSSLKTSELDESQLLELIRAYGLTLIRLGDSGGEDVVVKNV